MKTKLFMRTPLLVAALLAAGTVACAQTYITHANVLDVTTQKVLTDQTIVIKDANILQVGPSKKISPPKGAHIIDVKGEWVMPGLVDAHVHFFQTGGLYTRPDAIDLRKYQPYEKETDWYKTHMGDQLLRYLSCGITTVIDDGATYNLLHQRDTFARKGYLPRVIMAGPLLSTAYAPKNFGQLPESDEPFQTVSTPEEAVKALRQQYAHKPDLIKIWYIADKQEAAAEQREPIVKAIIQEAHAQRYRVAVHATELFTAKRAVAAGADFLVHSVEDTVIDDAFVKLLKERKVVLSPTLVVIDGYYSTFGQHYVPSPEDIAKGDPEQLGSLQELRPLPDTGLSEQYKALAAKRAGSVKSQDSIRKINLKKLADAGVTLATGTDAGNIGTLHASSYFSELRAMQAAGLSNWQVITASTLNGAMAAGREQEFGSIAPGKSADLLILKGNPVSDLQNLQQIRYVVNRGKVMEADSLLADSPETIVQKQLNAYNAHDIDAFLQTYAEDAAIYRFPDKQLAKGQEALRKMYGFLEKTPGLHATVTNRIVRNNVVIDHERLTIPGDRKGKTGIAVYFVEGKKISKVYFIDN